VVYAVQVVLVLRRLPPATPAKTLTPVEADADG
jgi:hypothetical protein